MKLSSLVRLCHQRLGSLDLTRRWRRVVIVLLASLVTSACDHTFEPFMESDIGTFSMYGFLDLLADTQWVRVAPIRHSLFLGPEPLDAVVTLEHVESGRVVALTDSLFVVRDERLGTTSYAHNFWTTEPIQRGGTYRLRAVRSDGQSSMAAIEMPPGDELISRPTVTAAWNVMAPAGNLMKVDLIYWMRDDCRGDVVTHPLPQGRLFTGSFAVVVRIPLELECLSDLGRHELLAVIAPTDWPFNPDLSDLEVEVPGKGPSNVENGIGYVGGLAVFRLPWTSCTVVSPRPDKPRPCDITYSPRAASIEGTVSRQCGIPDGLSTVRLIEEFARGGSILRVWKTGLNGDYRFEGIEAGSRVTLEQTAGMAVARAGPMTAGERRIEHIRGSRTCEEEAFLHAPVLSNNHQLGAARPVH